MLFRSRHFPRSAAVTLTLIPLLLVLLPALEGCEDDAQDTSTSGRRVTLKTTLEAPDIAAPFTNSQGWKVTLSSASIATGPLYYFDGTPPFTRAPRGPARSRWAALFGPSIAWAHPGHYVPGNARGQVLKAWSVDLFAGTADLPDGDGIAGYYRSGRFSFATPTAGPVAGALETNVAVVRGLAEKEGTAIHFLASTDLSTLTSRAPEGHVEGCVFEETDVQSDGTVRVSVKPSVWFNLVDFAGLEPGSQDAPTSLPPGENAHIGFLTGLAQLSAYHFHHDP